MVSLTLRSFVTLRYWSILWWILKGDRSQISRVLSPCSSLLWVLCPVNSSYLSFPGLSAPPPHLRVLGTYSLSAVGWDNCKVYSICSLTSRNHCPDAQGRKDLFHLLCLGFFFLVVSVRRIKQVPINISWLDIDIVCLCFKW